MGVAYMKMEEYDKAIENFQSSLLENRTDKVKDLKIKCGELNKIKIEKE